MAARLPTPRFSIQHGFTTQDGWRLLDLSLSVNGNIAATGLNENTNRTYIDVFTTNVRHPDSRDKPKIIYSKEFEKYSDEQFIYNYRLVSFIDDDVLVSCIGDKLEVFQVHKDEVLRTCTVNGEARCLSVRERREIFIGFLESIKITVYNVTDLNEIKSVVLQGIQEGYWPWDMTAIADRIFVCEVLPNEESNQRSLIFEEKNGRILSELTKPTNTVQWYPMGLALCTTLNVIAVVWSQTYAGTPKGKDVIVFYSLLSENSCSFLVVQIPFYVDRIRISDRGDMMIWRDEETQECKVFDMSEFISYGHLKENLQSQLQKDDCLKLADYFALPDDQRDKILESDTPTGNLLPALEGEGVIQPSNVEVLADAFTELGIKSSCSYLIDFYQKIIGGHIVRATPYDRFLATLSAHLTASLPADLCRYFDISDEKKSSITSSPDPGLALLLALDETGIINPSAVEALEQPFSELKLVQAESKIYEYQLVIEEEKNRLQRQTDLTEAGKNKLFIQCFQKKIQSWYETMTPVPWKKSCRWKSTDLFVGSGLVLTDSTAKRTLTDIDEECKLQYNQILNHNRLKAEKRIILEGEPGSGKTMMSSQLAYDWSQGKISEVDVIVFLPLKFVNNVTLVVAMKRFYFSAYDSISVNDIESFLTNEDLQSCLILDGFEEYNSAEMTPAGEPSEVTKVMERSKYPNVKVILTTRSDYTKDLPTCPMLRIGRFGEKERHAYIEKIFADNTEKQQEVERVIENNPFILDLCSVPLLFVLAVHNIESIAALQESQLDRVAPFMENMVKTLCTLPDSKTEGSVSDSEGVTDESLGNLPDSKNEGSRSDPEGVSDESLGNSPDSKNEGSSSDSEGVSDESLGNLPESKNEGSLSDSEGVSDESQLEEFAYNGLCKGQQILSWQRDVLEANITNLKQFLDSGILVVEEEIVKGNIRIIQDEKTQEEFSQDKKKTKKIKKEATGADQMNQSAQVVTGAMVSSFYQDYSVSEGSNENITTASGRPVSYATEEHISSRKRSWKGFTPKIFTKKRVLHSEGTTTKTGSSVRTQELASCEEVQADTDPAAREYSGTSPPASGFVQLKPESLSEQELSESQKTSNSSTAKDYPLEVKFLHKVMQEWFASKHFSSLLWKALDDCSLHEFSYEVLPQISPIDLHYILRFTSYLCPPSCYLIMDFLSQNHRSKNGVIPEYIMNCICLCFAECKQENVPQMTDLDKAVMKVSLDLVVAKLCREVVIIRSDDSRITQQSKVALLKYATSVGIPIKEVHLVDVVVEADETSTTLTSGVTFDTFNMIEILEISRWDQHLEQKDYQSIVNLVLCSNSIKKARLHFPSQPPDIENEGRGDLVIYDKTVEWIIGPKLIQTLNMETFKWEVTSQRSDVHAPAVKQISAAEAVVGAHVENYFVAEEPEHLTISVGDIITDITLVRYGWWQGEVNGERGRFPCNNVKVVILNPSKPAARTRGVWDQVDTRLIQTVEAQVMYNYDAVEPDELTIKIGDTITDISIVDDGWWKGVVHAKEGIFPSNFVKVCRGLSENSAQNKRMLAKVCLSHTPERDSELFLVEDDIIEITSRPDPWWWEGIVVKGKKGYFPSYCVDLLQKDERRKTKLLKCTKPVEARAKYDYDAVKPEELTLKVGDTITDITVAHDGWWEGVVNGKRGMFPSNCVEECKGTSESSTQSEVVLAKVVLSHTPLSDDELSLVKDDIIEITSQLDPLWWEGIVNGYQGHFPSFCVAPIQKDGEGSTQQEYATPGELLEQPLTETEAIITKDGATVTIPGTKVVLNIPPDALPEHMDQCVIKMRIIPRTMFQDPVITFSSNSSLVVEILPNKLLLRHPAQLVIPHCLLLKGNEAPTAKVFMSHHERGCSSSWEEHSSLEYRVERTCCVVWLNSFCWVAIKIDDKEVFAKELILYTCGKSLMPTDDHAEIAVGYYPDLAGEAKFLSLNKNPGVVKKAPFTFMKEGCHPLRWSLEKFPSNHWNLYFPEENNEEIAYKDISASVEKQCTFILEKTFANARNPMCIFKASQDEGLQPVRLAICPAVDRTSRKRRSDRFQQSLKNQGSFGEKLENPSSSEASATSAAAAAFMSKAPELLHKLPDSVVSENQKKQSQYFSSHPLVGHFPSGSHPQTTMTSQDDGMNSTFRGDDNIQPRKLEEKSRTPEEQLRRCFMFLKKNLARDWKDLGRCLTLVTEDELARLGKEHKDDIEESIYQMLLSWQRKNGALATPEMLIDALNEIFRKDLADKLLAAL